MMFASRGRGEAEVRRAQPPRRLYYLRRRKVTPAPVTTPPFDPSELPGLLLWLAADSLPLDDGAPVASWPDSSGAGWDAIQATTSSQPTYAARGFGGRPAVQFDGSDDYLHIDDDGSLGPARLTVCVVARLGALGRFHGFLGRGVGFWSSTDYGLRVISDNSYDFFLGVPDGSTPHSMAVGTADTSPHITTGSYDGVSRTLERDGLALGQELYALDPPSYNPGVYLGAYAGGAGLSFLLEGEIAEVLIYAPALSSTDRDALALGLGAKYGIAVG
jgi:hypothetical protein